MEPIMREAESDVVVVGAGNAGLCAAITAREAGARVEILEKAPFEERGGNSAFTGGLFRFAFDSFEQMKVLLPNYSPAEMDAVEVPPYNARAFADDCEEMTEGLADPTLVDILVKQSFPTMTWLQQHGVQWMLATGRQAFKSGNKFHFFGNLILEANGGGRGLVDALFRTAEKSGVEILYESKATNLKLDDQARVIGLEIQDSSGRRTIRCRSVVLASGGFQANAEMRCRYLGKDWELAKVRGTRFNTGEGIRMALNIGAQSFGHYSSCHAVAWDVQAPPMGDLAVGDGYQKHSYPLGIIVNREGKRFVDEGADFRNYTYAKYGREILKQPARLAFQIFDNKVIRMLRDEYRIRQVTKARANTIEQLADELTIDPQGLRQTIEEYNASVQDGDFNPSVLDGKRTRGITPPKSNWALRIDEPPFEGYAVTCGLTFTFGGLRVDKNAQVLDTEDHPIPGLYAAGELLGGLFYYNYAGGSGLMAGSVFGRIAGASAASRFSNLA
ncbi:MAG: FAD-dependent tricarballylate dehydrogenase TcuA [Chloroflexi bacterium]|nr:FAD-dependent tricarballylate dehydrogenase TcuA [Chloroflexota bacterium]